MRYDFKTLISILIILSFLFPVPVGAKITPKDVKKDKKMEVITIKKGDTLWDLAKLYYKDSVMWKKFEEFNIITDPDLIFPGEKLVVSTEDAKKIKEILEERAIEVKEEIKKAKEEPKKVEVKEVEVREIIKVKEVKVPPDEVLLKKIAKLEEEITLLNKERGKLKEEKNVEVASLKKEEEMLQASILELEEKLGGEKTQVAKLKKEKQEAQELTYFLSVGVLCGIVLLNTFK